MTNIEVAKLFRQIAAAMAILDEKKYYFQMTAYQKAADAVAAHSEQVGDLLKENRLDEISGIGTTMKDRLKELFEKGHVEHFDSLLKQIPPAVFPLLEVPHIGPKKAYKLVTELKLKNAETVFSDLRAAIAEGKVAKIEKFGEKSQSDVLRALDEFDAGAGKTTRMLLPFADKIATQILEYMKKFKGVKRADALGSMRRRVWTVGDIDLAVACDDTKGAIEHFVNYPYASRTIEQGPATASILTNGGQQIDLMVQPTESYGALLQHFTGSKHHNVHLREIALKKKLSLNEYGIKKAGAVTKSSSDRKKFPTEESFYEYIGLDWVPPEMREDRGEIELAIKHDLPKLVELKDIKGDLHIHSNFNIEPSHDLGADTMDSHVKRAIELGYSYIGFSEHNPSVSKHDAKESFNLIQKRNERIEQIQKDNKSIRILKLLETDILVDGKLSIDEKSLNLLDATIVSVHSSFGMDRETMTKRILSGLSHPKAKILAHPTGRLFESRESYDADWEKVFAFCVEKHKALEINAWPERTDLPDSLIFEAIKKGVKLVIDTDSHALSHMDLMEYGVWNARRGWATKADILNCLGTDAIVKWLEK